MFAILTRSRGRGPSAPGAGTFSSRRRAAEGRYTTHRPPTVVGGSRNYKSDACEGSPSVTCGPEKHIVKPLSGSSRARRRQMRRLRTKLIYFGATASMFMRPFSLDRGRYRGGGKLESGSERHNQSDQGEQCDHANGDQRRLIVVRERRVAGVTRPRRMKSRLGGNGPSRRRAHGFIKRSGRRTRRRICVGLPFHVAILTTGASPAYCGEGSTVMRISHGS